MKVSKGSLESNWTTEDRRAEYKLLLPIQSRYR